MTTSTPAFRVSRRALIGGAAVVGGAASLGGLGAVAATATQSGLKPLKLAWNASGVCLSPVALAYHRGIFANHGLDVELINFGASTEQLLEAIATGKADAGVGMALRWLKPMEQGFDVKITAGTHGGCLRLLAPKASGITDVRHLKGKTVAVSDQASPAKNFFSIMLAKRGIDPLKEVTWRQYPADLLALAVEKGEADALTDGDPRTYMFKKKGDLVEVATNLSDEYKDRACCILGIRGSLIRQDKPAAAALTHALLQAQSIACSNYDDVANVFLPYAVGGAKVEDIAEMLRSHTHNHSPTGDALKREITAYADELKQVSVFKPTTDTAKFADRVYANVLT